MSFPLPYVKFRAFVDATNLPLVGGKLYSYVINTVTPKALYADAGLVTPLTNPVILDSNGEATIYGDGAYDLRLDDALDVTLWTADNIEFNTSSGSVINTSLEWIEEITTNITFLDSDSFSITGDHTDLFHVNRRVKIDLSASSLYGTVTASSFGGGETTIDVLLDSGSLIDDIQSVWVGILDSINDSIPRIVGFLELDNVWNGLQTFNDTVTVDADLGVTGSLDVDTNLNVDGSGVIDLTLSVGTDLTVGEDLVVTGDAGVGGNLTVVGTVAGGAATFDSLGIDVAAPATGEIETSGDITAGGLVFATEGYKHPGTGGETLRTVRGAVDSAGAVIEGSGFTAVRNSTGDFTITFSTAFSDVPSFFGTPVAATGNRSVTIVSASTTQINYQIRANNDNALANNDHYIIVEGPF